MTILFLFDRTLRFVGDGVTRFDALALDNIDADTTVDQWSISSDSPTFTAGGNCTAHANNPSGEPANDQN